MRAGRRFPEAREQSTGAPHAAEVVHLHHAADEVEIDREIRASRGHPRVVEEEVDRRMALQDLRGHRVDRVSVGDVAQLDLAAELLGDRAEPILRRATSTHCHPFCARSRAVASPIPDDAPVTTAIRRPGAVSSGCARRRHGRTP